MKPWEDEDDAAIYRCILDKEICGPAHKLAAAAPEMARLLLGIVEHFESGHSAGEVGDWLADTLDDRDGVVSVLKRAGVIAS